MAASENRSMLIEAGGVLAGPELVNVLEGSIAIEEGVITEVGAREEIAAPAEATLIEASGLTIAPGFIDAHVHMGFYEPAEVVRGGVTTARDLAWPPELIFPLVAESRRPDFIGPKLLAAGPMLTADGGYPTRAGWAPTGTGRVVGSPDEARMAVAEVAERGAAIVKVALNAAAGPTLDLLTLRQIVGSAHERGLRVTAHITGLAELEKALDAGVDELAHMLMSAESIPDPMIARMVKQDVTVVPTLAVRHGRDRRIAINNLKRFRAAGGKVVYGTDLGNDGPRPGIDKKEVTAMAEAGMSPHAIIASATVDAASYLDLDATGAIVPGNAADLVAFDGNPLDGVPHLTKVAMVFRDGRRLL